MMDENIEDYENKIAELEHQARLFAFALAILLKRLGGHAIIKNNEMDIIYHLLHKINQNGDLEFKVAIEEPDSPKKPPM